MCKYLLKKRREEKKPKVNRIYVNRIKSINSLLHRSGMRQLLFKGNQAPGAVCFSKGKAKLRTKSFVFARVHHAKPRNGIVV